MDRGLEYRHANSRWSWCEEELQDGPPLSTDVEHVHAACTPARPLFADTVKFPPRLTGLTGALSLHDYRKHLSQSAESVDDPVDRSEKKLKRKTATSNLNRSLPLSKIALDTASVASSVASSPPPLSPSCSQSFVSQRSEQDEGFGITSGKMQPSRYLKTETKIRNIKNKHKN